MHRARLPLGLGVEGVPGRAARCTARPLPAGLQESDQLPEPVFTPSTKSDVHDENISFEQAVDLVGKELADRPATSRSSSTRGAPRWRAERGIIIADTKFELGLVDGELVLCDEVMTPDSSRFWPVDEWKPGATPPSFDKQPVRDYLETLDWDKNPPPPPLPARGRRRHEHARYIEAYERITGRVVRRLARRGVTRLQVRMPRSGR